MPGMPGLPGMGAGGGFPAPGSYDGQNNADSGAAASGAGAAPPANPFASLFGGGAPGAGANPFGMDPAMLQNLLGGGGAGAGASPFGGLGGFGAPAAPAAPQDTRPLEERYQQQLLQLNEMGLCDPGQNIRALSMTGGNVNAAVELIFSGRESFFLGKRACADNVVRCSPVFLSERTARVGDVEVGIASMGVHAVDHIRASMLTSCRDRYVQTSIQTIAC
jgi:hypothetical protein